MMDTSWRQRLIDFISQHALPIDKFSHQPRLYSLASQLGSGIEFDDDILFAACWFHDLGVFIGHRPEDPAELARWDNVAYAIAQTPGRLESLGFPEHKITAVQDAIQQHHPKARPQAIEAILLHDADLLELLGAIGLLRTISKVGRDTRYPTFSDILPVIEHHQTLAGELLTETARELAKSKLALMRQFILQAMDESQGIAL